MENKAQVVKSNWVRCTLNGKITSEWLIRLGLKSLYYCLSLFQAASSIGSRLETFEVGEKKQLTLLVRGGGEGPSVTN